ncbi:2-oxoacid:acceptor oxidoreductase family protein [Candidatus Alkanophaga liquidiphilum]|nr:Pyruvate:ferredoxin oxidoreductase or related 2-oxoacid:ferredoxin oxidoreductase [Candidatus Alkanophaga liquidiphilum]RLG36830.1 MAG: pyruvate ferredoxin oxidoreductase [Candidatus Alkanophagales archaeon]
MVWSVSAKEAASESDAVRAGTRRVIEIRLHSRGGQGGVTAAKMLAVAAFLEGKYSTASSFYGAERRGAPTVSFTRISDHEIRKYSQIRRPDCVIVMDPTVIDAVDVTEGLKPGGKLLINTENNIDADKFEDYEVYTVNATKISLDFDLKVAGAPVLNVPIVGAVAKMGIVRLDAVRGAILKMFPNEKNVAAAEVAYKMAAML